MEWPCEWRNVAKDVPDKMKTKIGWPLNTIAFWFINSVTLGFYIKKITKKIVLVLSLMHSEPTFETNGKLVNRILYNHRRWSWNILPNGCKVAAGESEDGLFAYTADWSMKQPSSYTHNAAEKEIKKAEMRSDSIKN